MNDINDGVLTEEAELLACFTEQALIRIGYRIELEETTTEYIKRLYRPDGSVAVTARRPKQ